MTVRLLLLRLITLAALGVSAVLLVSYLEPQAAFCGYDSGCSEVKHSRLGEALGISLPILGVAGFGAVLGLSLVAGSRSGRVLRWLAVAAGLAGLVFLLLQLLVIGKTCPYCVFVDGAALALAVVAVAGGRHTELPAAGMRARVGWSVGGALALLAGAAWVLTAAELSTEPLPEEVRRLYVPDKINIVEVGNFACPHCREMDHRLRAVLAQEGKNIHLIRFMVGSPAQAEARTAGQAYLCAEKQGKGKEMAEELFAAGDLSIKACTQIARSLGLNMKDFQACVIDPKTEAQIDANLAWLQKASPRGLPVVWIQDRMLFGVPPEAVLRNALEEARQRVAAQAHQTPPPAGTAR